MRILHHGRIFPRGLLVAPEPLKTTLPPNYELRPSSAIRYGDVIATVQLAGAGVVTLEPASLSGAGVVAGPLAVSLGAGDAYVLRDAARAFAKHRVEAGGGPFVRDRSTEIEIASCNVQRRATTPTRSF